MRIAVLGTGMMGGPMARRLCDAGHAVQVWNRTRAKAEPLAEQGAAVHDTARGAVAGAELVVTMLENGPVTESVLFDAAEGVAAALAPGALLVDMASIRPAEAREHAARLRVLGIGHVDAPVSGGTIGAQAGTLAIMAGGDEAEGVFGFEVFADDFGGGAEDLVGREAGGDIHVARHAADRNAVEPAQRGRSRDEETDETRRGWDEISKRTEQQNLNFSQSS
jgi:6-phosphogluconate dehydrogenase (decarboxylating)